LTDIDEVSVGWLPHLVDAKGPTWGDLPDPSSNAEPFSKPFAYVLSEASGPSGEQIDTLGHALLIAVDVDGIRPEDDRIGTMRQNSRTSRNLVASGISSSVTNSRR
jgi:hypothetical protein